MTKRLLLLGGLAIVAVVLNHAAGYGQIALFLWTDRYLPVDVPYWTAFGSLTHYVLLAIREICVFAVPAFLFVAGFFSAYVARGDSSKQRQWKTVFKRVYNLVVPYVFWSILIFIGDALQGITYAPLEYVAKLLSTGASGYLFFVPLLCSCYLLSPWIVGFAQKKPRMLLFVAALLQVGVLVVNYLHQFNDESSALTILMRLMPFWLFPYWIIYFALGSVIAFNIQSAKSFLARYRWHIAALTVIAYLLNVLEADFILQRYQTAWIANVDTLSYNLYATAVIACFLAFSDIQIPCSKALSELSKRSYGLYLLHLPVIDLTARVVRLFVPQVLAYQVVLVPLFFAVGLGVPLLVMELVRRWRLTHRAYRWLFG